MTPQFDQQRFGPVRQALHDWKVVVGGGAAFKPKYEGSDEYEVSPVPFVSAEFFDMVTIDPTGIDVKVYETDPIQLDVKVGYDTGRDEDDSDNLRGMGDVDFGVTVGGKVTYEIGPVDLFVALDKTISGSDGLLVEAGAAVKAPISEHLILGAEASATFADENYMDSYFGVTAAQSSRSGHREYNPGAGIKSAGLTASATYLINASWAIRVQQSVDILLGDAADSPIVQEKLQSSSMLVVGYRF